MRRVHSPITNTAFWCEIYAYVMALFGENLEQKGHLKDCSKFTGITSRLAAIFLITMAPTVGFCGEVEDMIDAAMASIGSDDRQERADAAAFFLAALPEFGVTIVNRYRDQIASAVGSLPQQIDSNTTAESIGMTDEEITFVYRLHMDRNSLSAADARNIRDEVKRKMLAEFCTNPGTALHMLYGHKITRAYSYNDGSFFFHHQLEWDDCERR